MSQSPRPAPPITVLGVPFDNLTVQEAVERVEEMIRSGRPHYIATANVDFLTQARRDLELRRILFDAPLVVCDGTPLLWASRLLGNPLPERVAGSDLTPLLLDLAEKKAYGVFLLGGSEASNEAAAKRIQSDYPNARLAGRYSPPLAPLLDMDHADILRRIDQAKPDILLVAFGCPKQEKWIHMHWKTLGTPVAIGVGATIDFLAGASKRAPVWMQKAGMEWIYRTLQEPRRLARRYWNDLWVFLPGVAVQWWRLRKKRGRRSAVRPDAAVDAVDGFDAERIALAERFDAAEVKQNSGRYAAAAEDPRPLLADVSAVQMIDSTGIGQLIRISKDARAAGRPFVVLGRSEAVDSALSLMRLDALFERAETLAEAADLIRDRAAEGARLSADEKGEGADVKWRGEITADSVDRYWRNASEKLASVKGGAFSFDLQDVRFIDSSGVGLLVKIKKRAAAMGVDARFARPSDAVQSVVGLSGLTEFLLNEGPR